MKNNLLQSVVVLTLSALGGCAVWPVDQDPAGMNYRRDSDRVILALQSYRHDKGAFPRDLNALVPSYIAALPEQPVLDYHALDGSLSYRYTPSWPQLRPVWCESVGNTTEWRCAEHLL